MGLSNVANEQRLQSEDREHVVLVKSTSPGYGIKGHLKLLSSCDYINIKTKIGNIYQQYY